MNFKALSKAAIALLITLLVAISASAADTVKIAVVEPLSGGAASAGLLSQKTAQFYIDRTNAAGGLNGQKLVLMSYDNKTSAQETLVALQKALDDGARYILQGSGSAFAHAITDAVLKYNERNPGKEALYFNFAAIDPDLTNAHCNYWHFSFDANVDMKMAALTDFLAKDKKVKKVYLINQDYSFGHAVAAAAETMLKQKRLYSRICG